jgi:hypothetical protein
MPRTKHHVSRPKQLNSFMNMSRRGFVSRTAVGLLGAATLSTGQGVELPGGKKGQMPLVVSTWPFGRKSNDVALKVLLQGGSILDAVEQGIWVAESDSPNASVGLGGKGIGRKEVFLQALHADVRLRYYNACRHAWKGSSAEWR